MELSPRIIVSSLHGLFQIFWTTPSILGDDFIIPFGGVYEHDGCPGECCRCVVLFDGWVGLLISIIKSLGLDDVMISIGGVPGESDSMFRIFTVGENFSFCLLIWVKLALSDELEYSCLCRVFLSLVACSAAAFDFVSNSDGFVSLALAFF